MNIDEFVKCVGNLLPDEIQIPKNTIKRWAFTEGVIPKPTTLERKGRGFTSNWRKNGVKETVAVWAVRDLAKKQADKGVRKRKKLSAEEIHKVRKIAKRVFKSPEVLHELPPELMITTPNPLFMYDFRALKTKVVDDDNLNDLVITWIAAREKAQRNIRILQRVRVTINWFGESPHPLPPLSSVLPIDAATSLGNPVLKAISQSEKRVFDAGFAISGFGILGAYDPSEIQTPFKRGKTHLKALRSGDENSDELDELLVFLNGNDSRKKALYAPFDRFDSSVEYDRNKIGGK
jgi:hypothetical protein